jgi:hypothetical protein
VTLANASFADAGAIATFVVAFVTLCLVAVTYQQGRLARRTLDLSVRPLLADAMTLREEGHPDEVLLVRPPVETIQFGPPGRDSVQVLPGQFYYAADEGKLQLSVAFRNVGAGVAVIKEATTDPEVLGSVYVSRKFVPVTERVRVNVSILLSGDSLAERFKTHWWAMERFAVSIAYTDAHGRQPMVSRAEIKQAATQAPWVEEIAVFDRGQRRHAVVGRSST